MEFTTGFKILQATGWAVFNSLWQFAFLWVAYKLILTTIFSQKGPAFKSALSAISLFAGMIWSIITLANAYTGIPQNSVISSSIYLFTGDYTINDYFPGMIRFMGLSYIIILLLPARQFIINYRYLSYIRSNGLKKISAGWRVFVAKTASQTGIKKKITVWISELVSSPVTIGCIKPMILLPVAAINHLSPQQVEAILLHEISHIKRNDYLVNFIITIIKNLFYFNPFTRMFVKEIEREREFKCDDLVMQFGYDPQEYASALLILEKSSSGQLSFAIAATGRPDNLLRRVEKIVGVSRRENNFSFRRMIPALSALLFIGFSHLLLTGNTPFFSERIADRNFTNSSPAFANEGFLSESASMFSSRVSKVRTGDQPERLNQVAYKNANTENIKTVFAPGAVKDPAVPDIRFANYTIPDIIIGRKLSAEEEKKMKETVESTKKIIEETQWREMERSYADALSSLEKEKVKVLYEKAMQEQNWNELEKKIRSNYNAINWEKVNAKINFSLDQIRTDSIQNALDHTITELKNIQDQMKEYQVSVIPDTDLTLQAIEQQKKAITEELNRLRTAKNKKIIRL